MWSCVANFHNGIFLLISFSKIFLFPAYWINLVDVYFRYVAIFLPSISKSCLYAALPIFTKESLFLFSLVFGLVSRKWIVFHQGNASRNNDSPECPRAYLSGAYVSTLEFGCFWLWGTVRLVKICTQENAVKIVCINCLPIGARVSLREA